jgi:hypothetical protein
VEVNNRSLSDRRTLLCHRSRLQFALELIEEAPIGVLGDETRVRADAERRLLQPRNDAEAVLSAMNAALAAAASVRSGTGMLRMISSRQAAEFSRS